MTTTKHTLPIQWRNVMVNDEPQWVALPCPLIAAAPALLEALEAAYMVLNSLDPDDSPGGRQRLADTLATIRAAIKLARGEP